MDKKRTALAGLLVLGILLTLGPMWGLLCTVFGIVATFNEAAHTATIDPATLAREFHFSLYTTVAGLFVCPLGIAMVAISAIRLSKLKQEEEARGQQS